MRDLFQSGVALTFIGKKGKETSADASAQWRDEGGEDLVRGGRAWLTTEESSLAEGAENAEERCTSVHRTAVRGEGREEEKEEKRGG